MRGLVGCIMVEYLVEFDSVNSFGILLSFIWLSFSVNSFSALDYYFLWYFLNPKVL